MNLDKLSALQLGKLVNGKQLKPREVLEYFLKKIEDKNDAINAVVDLHIDEAIKECDLLQERIMNGETHNPFAGVPILFKDFLSSKPGWTHSFGGVTSLMSYDEDRSKVYNAAKILGMISLGKTNAPNFGFAGTCDNKKYGPTRNPFNLEYNSGGSSGGAAAAVASGMCLIAEGGDAGGSIRIPASWCNCFGYKPSGYHTNSFIGKPGLQITHPICTDGVITRTVEDSLTIVKQMYNNVIDFDTYNMDVKDINIAVTNDFNLFYTDSEICDVIRSVANKLKDEGANVHYVDFKFDYSASEFADMWCKSISVGTASDLNKLKSEGIDMFKDHADELSPEFIYWNMEAAKSTIFDFELWHQMKENIRKEYTRILDEYDIILSPVTCCMPVTNKYDGNTRGPSNISNNVIGFAETFLVNFLGLPSASVPGGFGKNNLPIGVQVTGNLYRDNDVIAVSKFLELANPWNYDNIVV